jgi:hypothetical protein
MDTDSPTRNRLRGSDDTTDLSGRMCDARTTVLTGTPQKNTITDDDSRKEILVEKVQRGPEKKGLLEVGGGAKLGLVERTVHLNSASLFPSSNKKPSSRPSSISHSISHSSHFLHPSNSSRTPSLIHAPVYSEKSPLTSTNQSNPFNPFLITPDLMIKSKGSAYVLSSNDKVNDYKNDNNNVDVNDNNNNDSNNDSKDDDKENEMTVCENIVHDPGYPVVTPSPVGRKGLAGLVLDGLGTFIDLTEKGNDNDIRHNDDNPNPNPNNINERTSNAKADNPSAIDKNNVNIAKIPKGNSNIGSGNANPNPKTSLSNSNNLNNTSIIDSNDKTPNGLTTQTNSIGIKRKYETVAIVTEAGKGAKGKKLKTTMKVASIMSFFSPR